MSFKFEGIGTHWDIDIAEELSGERELDLQSKIKERIEVFDKDYSRFRKDSLVTEMSKKAGKYEMPSDFEKMISLYKTAYDLTHGLVTPLIGNVLVQAGYDANYSLKKGKLIRPKTWEDILKWQNPNLILDEPVVLDFGACGKGYLVDIVGEIIEEEGIKLYVVDASGDMRHRDTSGNELRVGLEHPDDKQSVIGVVKIKNQSLCGSAGNRRKWEDMHHIINPKTLSSPSHIFSAWAVAESTILADMLTTCLFFTPAEILKKHFNFEHLIFKDDYTIEKSDGFNVELFN